VSTILLETDIPEFFKVDKFFVFKFNYLDFIFILCSYLSGISFLHSYFFRYVAIHRAMSQKQKSYNLPSMIKHSFCSCIHTMMSYQLFQELCLTKSCHMLMWSMLLDEDDNDLIHLLYHHHLSVFYNNNFFFVLDSMFIWALSQTKSFQDSSQPTGTIPLTCCYHHTHFNICQFCELYHHLKLPVSFTISTRGHLASWEEAFIITITKQTATGRTSTSLTKVFTATMGTFISPESTRRQLKYLTLRQMGFYRAIACSIGCICSFSLWRPLGTSRIDCNMANYCLIMSILLFS
jgi:hypothetical protein